MLFQGADHGPTTEAGPRGHQQGGPDLRARASDRESGRSSGRDTLADEMNGEPLTREHGAPFRVIVPRWYAVASVKWLKRIDVLTEPYRGEFQTGHYMYEWPDRPSRGRGLHARTGAHYRPGARFGHPPRHLHGAGQGLVGNRANHAGRCQLHGRRRLARGERRSAQGALSVAGLVARVGGQQRGAPHDPCEGDRRGRNVQPDVPPWNRLGYGNNAIDVLYVDVSSSPAGHATGYGAPRPRTSPCRFESYPRSWYEGSLQRSASLA